MKMVKIKYDVINIDPEIADSDFTQNILGKFPDAQKIFSDKDKSFPNDASIKTLSLKKQKGRFLKACPGTPKYLCCGYYVLSIAQSCEIDCTYCILQEYFSGQGMTIFCNIEDLFNELDEFLNKNPQRFFRIGSGEFTDSLLVDVISDYNLSLIPYFLEKKNAVLEIKSKLDYLDNLTQFKPHGNIIASWSLNTPSIIRSEEQKSVSLQKRIEAAVMCQGLGYRIGFHFDPMIYYEGWEKDYRSTIDLIFEKIDPSNIVWISLGTLRFMSRLSIHK